jgi:hypothetical protein
MGMRTDAEIAAWQARAGLKLPSVEKRQLLHRISDKAFELIKRAGDGRIIRPGLRPDKGDRLEASGIRDGDSRWYGSDVIGGTFGDMRDEWAKHPEIAADQELAGLCALILRSQFGPVSPQFPED